MEIVNQRVLTKSKLADIVETEEGTQYSCVQCSERYFEKEKLEVHLLAHFKEYRFLCGICGTGLKRKEHLDRHTLGHQEVRPYVCNQCGKGFKRKEHLSIHRSIHTGDKNQICPICRRSFYRKDHLQKHLQTHNRIFLEQNLFALSDQEMLDIKREVEEVDVKADIVEDLGLGCEVSMEVEENTTLSQAPLSYTSSDPERPFACGLCHKTYKRKDHLKLHQYSHMAKDKICSECGKGFHRQEQLLTHISTVHMDPLTFYNDSIAPKFGSNSAPNVIHEDPGGLLVERGWEELRSIRPKKPGRNKDERRHECSVCGRRFKRKQHLKVHGNVHLRLQPTIWCSLCSEGFLTNTQFEKHQCTGQGSSEEQASEPDKKENDQPQQYPQFEEIDVEMDDLKPSCEIPQLSIEEEEALPTPARVFVCKFCGKPFKRKDHFKIHTYTHTGVKSFFCDHCGKGFYRKDHLQKHSQVHEKPQRRRSKKALPDLYPIAAMTKNKNLKPEITITAPSSSKLRVPLQIKVPYQMVLMKNGHKRSVTVNPQNGEM